MTRVRAAALPLASYVLHRHDWSETSLVVELLTRERGRVVVLAKGAKRPYSQLRGVLLPFLRLSVQLTRTATEQSELQVLRTADWAGGPPLPPGPGLAAGFYLNELLLRLTAREDAHPALFDAYADTLTQLSDGDDPALQTALRAFELRLLRETGLLPELCRQTLTLETLEDAGLYALHAEHGVVEARSAAEGAGLSGLLLREAEAALCEPGQADGHALRRAVRPALAAWRGQLRALLHYHLGPVPLRTRQVMLSVQGFLSRENPTR
jgi:DNA repair protein RecO (recombination protein O)